MMTFTHRGRLMQTAYFSSAEALNKVGKEYSEGWYFRPEGGMWFGPYITERRAKIEARWWGESSPNA